MRVFFQRIVGLALARMLLDMLLPEGDAGRWADLGAGLLEMLCLMEALRQILP